MSLGPCTAPGCEMPRRGRTWCVKHERRMKKAVTREENTRRELAVRHGQAVSA